MKVLVTGANGQLGTDLCQVFHDADVIPLTHAQVDITNYDLLKRTCSSCRPDVIINTAAYLRVDDCESNKDQAFAVNALGARNVAVVAEDLGSKLVHISTDYVFGGQPEPQTVPYTEFDTPVPVNVYGKSKLAGEGFVRHLCHRHFIVRTSGLFGVAGSSGKGGNFVETMLKLAREREQLKVVNDQIFSPTYTRDLANKIAELVTTDYYGIFHVTNSGACSWYEFTQEILRLAKLTTPLMPITSDQYPQKAKRPAYSVLDHYHLKLLGVDDIIPWAEALDDYFRKRHAA